MRILALLFITSCGSQIIDQNFNPYLAEILSWRGDTLRQTISIEFGRLSSPNVGRCGFNQITIDREPWGTLTENERLQLLAHELIHCNWGIYWHGSCDLMSASGFSLRPAKELFLECF